MRIGEIPIAVSAIDLDVKPKESKVPGTRQRSALRDRHSCRSRHRRRFCL